MVSFKKLDTTDSCNAQLNPSITEKNSIPIANGNIQ